MKKIVLAVLTAAALVAPSIAQADVTHQFPAPFNCSATAFTPTSAGGTLNWEGGESCAGSQFNYSKRINLCLQSNPGGLGWGNVTCTSSGWKTVNPLRLASGTSSFTHGLQYRTAVDPAEVSGGGFSSGMSVYSQAFTP